MASHDTEITLGTGKMLALFFGLVALCGLFFGLGFSLGRGSVRTSLSADPAQTSGGGAVLRPSGMKSGTNSPSGGMTYSNPIDQKDTEAAANDGQNKESANPATDSQSKSGPPDPMSLNAGPGYFVQVAAVSKPDDAQALVDALKKKQYTAFSSNASATDKFFHVQVGPFSDIKDAEATRAKLISDGYNPILKK